MARGMMVFADTQTEAEQKARDEVAKYPEIRVLRSKEIDMSDIQLSTGPPPKAFVVVLEDDDPSRPHDADPKGKVEYETRALFQGMATDPSAMLSGVIEQILCPICEKVVQLDLPSPNWRIKGEPEHFQCPECDGALVRPPDADRNRGDRLGWQPA
jgi:uncharacterized protein YlaI